ncbi:protein of unknown function [Taphrina deformans PYCC 5710]|uniref:Thioredoxin domain-containing protein n=1 Tax=Taphrina deformans (strain PYCC 5710 / ATCC 11124 / CBS 356.35 / IMI 108563 / JCM 9778 / NBRC 8474) TaxID=1097556 RepID=R4XK73_TAPDE|nr:protein of unknown function [Taphrina deformans PYCC 5710]|eukprot:CCG84849.1 protein of unknown function [Taphrina deformans PYCC 5710]
MQEITTLAQFHAFKSKPLLIIDFYADWCGPCKAISPVFQRLAEKHKGSTSIIFAKVNVDVARDVSSLCGISAMPTFQFWGEGSKKDEIRGADVSGLTRMVESLVASSSVRPGSGTGGTRMGDSRTVQGTRPPVPSGSGGLLRALVDLEHSRALNATPTSSIKAVLRPSFVGATVDSAAGPTLLLYVALTAAVNVTKVKVSVPGAHLDAAPSRIHIGTNVTPAPRDLMALARAETVQSFTVYSDEYVGGVTELSLKPAKFKDVTSLTILIDENVSSRDVTRVSQVELFGTKV